MSPYRAQGREHVEHISVRRARRYARWSLRHELAFERVCFLVGTLGLLATAAALVTTVAWALVAP